ncbi:hypothetical protein ACE193_22220 [Bernardetia sp. OM2101]|uniref:hypothetical protein n=1 Tax=Bernardetia sp. OM2101 TaxID=3344876 RepID=UPI0035CEE87D
MAQLSTNLPFPVTLYIDNALEIDEAKKLVIDKEAKFTIEKRQDYLMEKYKKLKAYKNKLKALTKSFH